MLSSECEWMCNGGLPGQWWWWWWYCEMQQKCRYCYCLPKTVSELSIENRTGVDEATVCCKSNNPPHGRLISSPWTDTSSLQHTHALRSMDNISLLALCCCSDAIFRKERNKQRNNKEVLSQKSVNTTIKKE
jgi:hypothetical protein